MKKTIGILAILYGIGLSSYFGWWALRDNAALEIAVRANAPQKEMRHRINVFAEGVWFLLSNMIVLQGVGLTFKSQEKSEERLQSLGGSIAWKSGSADSD